MTSEQNVSELMKNTMENLKDMIDVNTVIGDSVTAKDGTTIIPVSKLSFGFVSGGSEYPNQNLSTKDRFPFGGGSSAGVSVKPIAFLVVKDDSVRILHVDCDTASDKITDAIPQVLDIVKNLTKNGCKNKKKEDDNANYASYNPEDE